MNNLKVIADEILPVYENVQGEKFVNARELHDKLLSKQEFSNWIKRRIENYGFVEGEDFLTILSKSTGGRPSTEYLFALDTGKEIAMVENNEVGRAIRKYFIEVEKKLKQPKTQIEMLAMMAQQMVEQEKTNTLRDQKINALEGSFQTLTTGLTAVPDHAKVVDTVNEYARYTRLGHNEVYNGIYKIMKAQHGIDVKARVENDRKKLNEEYFKKTGKLYKESTLKNKVNGIDVMVRMGALDKFNSILVGVLAKAKGIEGS